MLDTLLNIGNIIKNHPEGKIKYNPLICKIDFTSKDYKDYIIYHFEMDLNNKSLVYRDIVPLDNLYVLKYDTGGNTNPYLYGDYISDKQESKISQNYLELCVNNLKNLGSTTNNDINDFCSIIINKIDVIKNTISSKKFAIKFTIKNNDINVNLLTLPNVIDSINEIYVKNITTNLNGNIIINNTILGFFKTNTNGLSQSPNFSDKESYKNLNLNIKDLMSLIYSTKFHENINNIISDYCVTILPNYEKLNYDTLESLLEKKYIQNYSKVIEELKNESKDEEELDDIFSITNLTGESVKNIKDLDIKFDLIFKLKGAQTTIDLSVISNYNFHKILLINKKIVSLKKEIYGLANSKYSIKLILQNFYKLYEKDKIDKWNNVIFKTIYSVFMDNYSYNKINDEFYITKACNIIRNEEYVTNKIVDLTKNYKFIKYMDEKEKSKDKELINTDTYVLGELLGKYCKIYQDDRRNLVKFVENFNGYINKKIRALDDITKYFDDFQQKLIINKCDFFVKDCQEINDMILKIRNDETFKFNKNIFIRGYFSKQYSYNNKQ